MAIARPPLSGACELLDGAHSWCEGGSIRTHFLLFPTLAAQSSRLARTLQASQEVARQSALAGRWVSPGNGIQVLDDDSIIESSTEVGPRGTAAADPTNALWLLINLNSFFSNPYPPVWLMAKFRQYLSMFPSCLILWLFSFSFAPFSRQQLFNLATVHHIQHYPAVAVL